jgi:hypothetical protein
MSLIFYYLTEDSGNLKEANEINYLRTIGRVVVVTRGGASTAHHDIGIKRLNLPAQSQPVVSVFFLWTKICYLLCRPSNSLTDKGFPVRNVYTGHQIVRWLINRLWSAKYLPLINKLLPTYEALYFGPFRLARLFVRDKQRSDKRFQRIVVHDSLILRLTRFTPFILFARRSGMRTVANVKSWDNPFYSQFVQGATCYLTWSQNMWRDVQRFHQLASVANHCWGPRPFYNFADAVRVTDRRPNRASGTIVLGYAAAFCDTLMAAHEVQVVAGLAKELLARGTDVKILLRPYPIVPMSSYGPLLAYPNVEIIDIKGPASDRYGDGREIIRFGSDEERMEYLSRCHFFLSIATSFTFEAAIFGLPVLQYFVPKQDRRTEHELEFFGRLDISDHIQEYFLKHLPVVASVAALVDLVKRIGNDFSSQATNASLMTAMGFPSRSTQWDEGSAHLVKALKLV